jgi:hypothetical protein
VQYTSLTRQTPPAVEPVTVAEAKAQLPRRYVHRRRLHLHAHHGSSRVVRAVP